MSYITTQLKRKNQKVLLHLKHYMNRQVVNYLQPKQTTDALQKLTREL